MAENEEPPARLVDSLLYLQFDFIRSLEYTITNECNCKIIYGEVVMEYLSIKRTLEKWGIAVRRIQVLCTEGRIPGATKIWLILGYSYRR